MEQTMGPQEFDEIKDLISALLTSVENLVLRAPSTSFLNRDSSRDSIAEVDTAVSTTLDKSQNEDIAVLQACNAARIEMRDSCTAMSQELELYPPPRQVQVQDAFTAMSQEFEEVLQVETKDSTTVMSQEFLMLQTPTIDHHDAFTASVDLYNMADVSTSIDIESNNHLDPLILQQQVVPTDSSSRNVEDDEFYGTENERNVDFVEDDSMSTHDHDYQRVPEYPDAEDKDECVLMRPTQPLFRRNNVKVTVMESNTPDSQSQDEMPEKSTSKRLSRCYEYFEDMDEDKENVAPNNAVQNHRQVGSGGIENMNSRPMYAPNPNPAPTNSGVFLRLGLSRRAKPTKRLHNTFRRLI